MTTELAVPHLRVAELAVGVGQHDAAREPERLLEKSHRAVTLATAR